MQPKGWKNLLLRILLASSSATCCWTYKVDIAWAANPDLKNGKDKLASTIPSLGVVEVTDWMLPKHQQIVFQEKLQRKIFGRESVVDFRHEEVVSSTLGSEACVITCSQTTRLNAQAQSSITQPPTDGQNSSPIIEQNQTPPTTVPLQDPDPLPPPETNNPLQNELPQLEGQQNELTKPFTVPQIDQRLPLPEVDSTQRLQRLLQRLQKNKQSNTESSRFGELGRLLVREKPLQQAPLPTQQQPRVQAKPVGYLLGRVGYFQTNNIFSSNLDPKQDGLFYSGLTLASAPLRVGAKTYFNGSIDGNIIRYIDQSQFNYNQVRFNLGLYQQISPKMYGEIGWSNQQFFYARDGSSYNAGERFLNENSVQLSFGRRDPLTPKLVLDSFYELRVSFTNSPNTQDNRDRITNSLWLSLNYYLKRSLQVGINYQFSLSDFTRRERQDQYHRLYGFLNYGVSRYTNLSFQGGYTLGNSTNNNIDFDGWFFSINYNLELGRF